MRDDPNIGPKEFLLAVMHDKFAPLTQRIRAAESLLRIEHGLPLPSVVVKVYGMGELELHEDFDTWPYEEREDFYRVISRLEYCNELGIGSLSDMQVQGHA
jgi:hypothetical protein